MVFHLMKTSHFGVRYGENLALFLENKALTVNAKLSIIKTLQRVYTFVLFLKFYNLSWILNGAISSSFTENI